MLLAILAHGVRNLVLIRLLIFKFELCEPWLSATPDLLSEFVFLRWYFFRKLTLVDGMILVTFHSS